MSYRLPLDDVVTRMFADLRPEREELVRAVSDQMRFSQPLRRFIAEVAERCVDARKQPVDALGYALMYGIVIGVLCEQERRRLLQ